jgi:UDP-glucose 4-epimerase
MRIAITGASGNVGTALLRNLVSCGEHDIVGIARRIPSTGAPYDHVEWHSVDLTADDAVGRLRSAFSGADAVVHLAWGFQPSHDSAYLERLGVGGTAAVLHATDAAGVRHLVHMSSVGAYSRAPGVRVDESAARSGVRSSPYSQHKAAAERLLDNHEAVNDELVIARIRPGFVLQRDAGSGLLRYGVPGWVPAKAIGLLRLLPMDRALTIPVVHADDLAAAIVRVVEQRASGAFNIAGEPPLTTADIAAVLHARSVHVPAKVLRSAADLAWRARLQAVDPGWIDLAFSVPLLNTERARTVLGWHPAVDTRQALAATLDGMRTAVGTASPVLRTRTMIGQLGALVRRGPLGNRREA